MSTPEFRLQHQLDAQSSSREFNRLELSPPQAASLIPIDRAQPLPIPETFDLKATGWDSFAEYLLDVSGLINKPYSAIPPLRGRRKDFDFSRYFANRDIKYFEERIDGFLRKASPDIRDRMTSEIEQYKQVIKSTVVTWREQELL